MITLTKDMEVGIPMIDSQHRELLNQINAVEQASSREQASERLDILLASIIKHFSDEEALQKKAGYNKCEPHHAQHELYISEFGRLKNEFENGGIGSKFSLDLIITWLVKHIKVADIEFGEFYRRK